MLTTPGQQFGAAGIGGGEGQGGLVPAESVEDYCNVKKFVGVDAQDAFAVR